MAEFCYHAPTMAAVDTITRLICPIMAETPQAMRIAVDEAVREGADLVELRLDSLRAFPSEADLKVLLADAPVPVLMTFRPSRQGGVFPADAEDEPRRLAVLRLVAASRDVAWVDVEHDTHPGARPGCKRLLSFHDFQNCPDDPVALAATMAGEDVEGVKLAFACNGPEEALRAMDVLRETSKPAIALAMGEHGLISRVLAGKFGAMGTFASLGETRASAPGQPTLREMRKMYRWSSLSAATRVFGVIGCPIAHSMSPAIHNAAFAETEYDGVYLPLRVEPEEDCFRAFLDGVQQRPWLGMRGLSVTIPHKQHALRYVGEDHCDDLALRIGAINTITMEDDGTMRGDNTDYAAVLDALCEAMNITRKSLAGRSAAVLGAGGVSRAIVAGLRACGAEVCIYNRTVSRAEALAGEFDCSAQPLDAAPQTEAEILINGTSLGMHPDVETSPLSPIPSSVKVVFDTVYNPLETRLLRDAAKAECITVSGLEMFVRQAAAQFETWTGLAPPLDVMRSVVRERLQEQDG